MGAWLSYGLGHENKDLPAFVVLLSGRNNPEGGKSCWGNGFLPTAYQGVEFRSAGDPVLYLSNPAGVTAEARRRTIDAIGAINRRHLLDVGDPETSARIASYELAYRMQTSVPASVHKMYGTGTGMSATNAFALGLSLNIKTSGFSDLSSRPPAAKFQSQIASESASCAKFPRPGYRSL